MRVSRPGARVIDGKTSLAQRWCALQVLHDRIEAEVGRALQPELGISVREFSLLDVLARQHDGEGGHLQMKDVAYAVGLSQSATTRLVARLEERGLLGRFICPDDRRGIYTDVTPTGVEILESARPLSDAALHEVLDALGDDAELAPFVRVLREEKAD